MAFGFCWLLVFGGFWLLLASSFWWLLAFRGFWILVASTPPPAFLKYIHLVVLFTFLIKSI